MNALYLYDFFKVVRNDERFEGTALPAYLMFLDLMQNKELAVHSFDDLSFILETLFVKDQRQQVAFRELLLARRSDIMALLETSKNIPETQLSSEDKDLVQSGIQDPADHDPLKNLANDEKRQPEEEKNFNASGYVEQQMTRGFGNTLIGFKQSAQKIGELAFSGLKNTNLPVTEKPFLFSFDFFPVNNRHLQQAWRRLKKNENDAPSDRINFNETIRRVAKNGYFADLVFHKKETNKLRLFIFIDHSLSMMAVEDFGRELASSAQSCGIHKNLQPYYFNILPEKLLEGQDYSVSDIDQEHYSPISKLFAGINKKNIAVLIYSDSGILKPGGKENLLGDTREFLRFINKRCSFIAWVNPAPKIRWKSTIVAELYNEVPTFDASRTGIEQAVSALKGKLTIKLANPYATAKST